MDAVVTLACARGSNADTSAPIDAVDLFNWGGALCTTYIAKINRVRAAATVAATGTTVDRAGNDPQCWRRQYPTWRECLSMKLTLRWSRNFRQSRALRPRGDEC